jgi:hypothetical protein
MFSGAVTFVASKTATVIDVVCYALWFKNFRRRRGKDTQTLLVGHRILRTGNSQRHIATESFSLGQITVNSGVVKYKSKCTRGGLYTRFWRV